MFQLNKKTNVSKRPQVTNIWEKLKENHVTKPNTTKLESPHNSQHTLQTNHCAREITTDYLCAFVTGTSF